MLSNKQVRVSTFFNSVPVQSYTWDLEKEMPDYITENDAYTLLKNIRAVNPTIKGKYFSIKTHTQTFYIRKRRGDYDVYEL